MEKQFVVEEARTPEEMKDVERWRINLQIKAAWQERRELCNDKQCPDQVIMEFDQKLVQMLRAQEGLLGGVEKPARGILPGTYVPPVSILPSVTQGDPWAAEKAEAVNFWRKTGRLDYHPELRSRRHRRAWAKVTPFRAYLKRGITRLEPLKYWSAQ